MCKLKILKQSIGSVKNLLVRYETLIPKNQIGRFQNDISMIFKDLEYIEDENTLENMNKLAKTKLKSIERVYGAVREDTKDIYNVEFLNDETIEYYKKHFGADPNRPYVSKLEEIKKSPGFNPGTVKKYQEEYKERKEQIQTAYFEALELNKQEKLKKKQAMVEDIYNSGSKIDLSSARDEEGNINKEKLKIAIRDIMAQNGIENADERAEEMDYNDMLRIMNGEEDEEEKVNKQNIKIVDEYVKKNRVDVTKSKELFQVFDTQKTINEDELNGFIEKVKPIFDNPNLTEDDKKKIFLKELDKHEEEWTRNNLDGQITYGPYGDIQFKIFKDVDEEDSENTGNTGNTDKSTENNDSNSNSESTGTKNFVWRDGKLVEGKAKQRKTVTYSNWHSGHVNPDDMRRHRDLLDRQHYGGPLWEGIKYQGNLTDCKGYVKLTPPTPEDLEELEKNHIPIPKEGKKEIVEIVR